MRQQHRMREFPESAMRILSIRMPLGEFQLAFTVAQWSPKSPVPLPANMSTLPLATDGTACLVNLASSKHELRRFFHESHAFVARTCYIKPARGEASPDDGDSECECSGDRCGKCRTLRSRAHRPRRRTGTRGGRIKCTPSRTQERNPSLGILGRRADENLPTSATVGPMENSRYAPGHSGG